MMISIKDTHLLKNVLKELNYPFADVYIFEGIIVSEIKEGVVFDWDTKAKVIIDDVVAFLNTDGSDLIYISNRVNSYSVVAQDWIKFYKNSYNLKGYYAVSNRRTNLLSVLIEGLFLKKKIKKFSSIYEAMNWIEKGLVDEVA